MARTPRVLRGFRDFPPQQMILRHHVISIFQGVFERYGFEPIQTPILEYLEVLSSKYGEDEKLIYHFEDRGGREVGLRYDLTVPLARFVATHRGELSFPFKRYHIEPVFRADQPQRGRYRQFWQCDADIVGTSSMMADAEVMMVWMDCLSAVNIPGFEIHVNHRKLLRALAQAAGVGEAEAVTIHRAVDKLEKIGRQGVMNEMTGHGISEQAASTVLDLVSLKGDAGSVLTELRRRLADYPLAQEGIEDLTNLFNYLGEMGADPRHYALDLSLARGLDYYTGPVFEAKVPDEQIGSLGGAGRYDGLVGMFIGEDMPATGCSLGLEPILDVVQDRHLLPLPSTVTDVLVTTHNDELTRNSLDLVGKLRNAGVPAEIYLGQRRDLRRQLQYANRKQIPVTAFLGEQEVASGVVKLKEMTSGDEVNVPVAELDSVVETVRRLAASARSTTATPE